MSEVLVSLYATRELAEAALVRWNRDASPYKHEIRPHFSPLYPFAIWRLYP